MRAAGTAIQDEIVTVRNDRFVIPVKTDFRGKVTGVAHGFSSSGQTVYVEPLEAIEANNELQNLRGQEEREVARILFALTEALREQLPAVESAVEAVTELDAIKAKVEFARKFTARRPRDHRQRSRPGRRETPAARRTTASQVVSYSASHKRADSNSNDGGSTRSSPIQFSPEHSTPGHDHLRRQRRR